MTGLTVTPRGRPAERLLQFPLLSFGETLHTALFPSTMVAPCLTVKAHPDRSSVTEPSVYTVRSCGPLFS